MTTPEPVCAGCLHPGSGHVVYSGCSQCDCPAWSLSGQQWVQPPERKKHRRGSENRERQHQVAVRLSPAENALLQAAAAAAGKSPASVLREAFMASVKVVAP